MSDPDNKQDATTEDDEAQELLATAADNSDDGHGAADEDDGDDGATFDESRARKKIDKANREAANLRKRLKELEPLANKAKELEDAQKTEQQKLADELEAAKSEGATSKETALRLEVALDKAPEGMAPAQIRKLAKRLSGSTREELEEDATELFGEFAPNSGGQPPSKKPTEALKGGGDPEKDPEPDADKVVDAVLKRRSGF